MYTTASMSGDDSVEFVVASTGLRKLETTMYLEIYDYDFNLAIKEIYRCVDSGELHIVPLPAVVNAVMLKNMLC